MLREFTFSFNRVGVGGVLCLSCYSCKEKRLKNGREYRLKGRVSRKKEKLHPLVRFFLTQLARKGDVRAK